MYQLATDSIILHSKTNPQINITRRFIIYFKVSMKELKGPFVNFIEVVKALTEGHFAWKNFFIFKSNDERFYTHVLTL